MGLLASQPDTVNSRGDKLDTNMGGGVFGVANTVGYLGSLTPQKRAEMMTNWLTGGGRPAPLDPSLMFGKAQAGAGVQAKAAAGQGINGLFGVGKMIGDLAPQPIPPVGQTVEPIKPLKMIEPMNQSPMQPGVPYSALPLAGAK